MVWGIDRLHERRLERRTPRIKAIDFAGGTVVHMTSGWSALDPLHDPRQAPRLRQRDDAPAQHGALHGRHRHALGRLVRLQRRFRRRAPTASPPTPSRPRRSPPPSPASSGPCSNGSSTGKPRILGFCSGIVAGLVVITPACGFVDRDLGRDHRRPRRRRARSSPAPTSRAGSATTTRSTPSASTPSAAPWVPSSPASSPTTSTANSVVGQRSRPASARRSDRAAQGHRPHASSGASSPPPSSPSSSRPSSACGRRPRSNPHGLDITDHGEEGYISS